MVLAYFIWRDDDTPRFQWFESYDATSDQPYGTSFMRHLLEDYKPGGKFFFNKKKPIHEILDSAAFTEKASYVFIGQSDYLDLRDINALTSFMERGNDVFIASLDPPSELIARIYENTCNRLISYNGERADTMKMNFYHPALKKETDYAYTYRFAGIDRPYQWSYLSNYVLCDSAESILPLGYHYGEVVNFLSIPYEKGHLYLHTNPLVFTNYFLLQPDKLEYASLVFSHLKGQDIIWDEYSKMPFVGNNNHYNSPLYFILAQPSLKYAWWLMLLTILLFVIFAAKRRQRIIPVLEEKVNTSLEFVRLISSLHFQNGDHLDMARKKMRYFLYFIKMRYGIHTSAFTQIHVPILAEKSKVKETEVQRIFDRWNVIDKFQFSSIEVDRLVDLYYSIDNFYKQCK